MPCTSKNVAESRRSIAFPPVAPDRVPARSGTYRMKIVVGLGNPGREYAATRHNLGFMVVDALARRVGATNARPRFKAEIAEAVHNGEKIVLVKPQTYMNLSGST